MTARRLASKTGARERRLRSLQPCGFVSYQLRDRFLRYGPDGLHPKHRRGRSGLPPELEAVVERRILAEALSQPAWGPQRLSDQLAMRTRRSRDPEERRRYGAPP